MSLFPGSIKVRRSVHQIEISSSASVNEKAHSGFPSVLAFSWPS